jgi:hypothetical protein
MRFKLVELIQLSGNKASIYTIFFDDSQKTSLETFIIENKSLFLSEIKNIISRLKIIGTKTGAREQYFRLNEGKPGDGVCALSDKPNNTLRLYCIRYANPTVIVGGGGPKNVQRLQQNKKLKDENEFLRNLSARITERTINNEIWFSDDNMDFEGDLTFNDKDDE